MIEEFVFDPKKCKYVDNEKVLFFTSAYYDCRFHIRSCMATSQYMPNTVHSHR